MFKQKYVTCPCCLIHPNLCALEPRHDCKYQCSTGSFQFRWLKGYSIAHVIIIIKSGVSTFPIVIIFFRGCVPQIFVIFCYLLYIHSAKTGNLFSSLLCSLWWVQMVGYVLAWGSYSFICTLHHLIIIIVQTYLKTLNLWMPVRYVLPSVWVRHNIFSQLSIIQHVWLCAFSLPISLVMIEKLYILCLIIIESEVWTITHCLWLGHERIVCAVCIFIFLYMWQTRYWTLDRGNDKVMMLKNMLKKLACPKNENLIHICVLPGVPYTTFDVKEVLNGLFLRLQGTC